MGWKEFLRDSTDGFVGIAGGISSVAKGEGWNEGVVKAEAGYRGWWDESIGKNNADDAGANMMESLREGDFKGFFSALIGQHAFTKLIEKLGFSGDVANKLGDIFHEWTDKWFGVTDVSPNDKAKGQSDSKDTAALEQDSVVLANVAATPEVTAVVESAKTGGITVSPTATPPSTPSVPNMSPVATMSPSPAG